MDIFLLVVAFLCATTGVIGSVVPGLPGPPFGWIGLLLLFFVSSVEIPVGVLIGAGVMAVVITLVDYIVPGTLTKRLGGSKAGVWGCNIGIVLSIVGLPFGPQGLLGLLFWPFVGAMVGELINNKPFTNALQSALGSFLGFLTGTFIKLLYSVVLLIYMIVRTI